MMGQLSLEQMEMEQLRQQVADLSARLDTAQVMTLERDAKIAEQAGRRALAAAMTHMTTAAPELERLESERRAESRRRDA